MNEIKVEEINREWANILSAFITEKILLQKRIILLEETLKKAKEELSAIKAEKITDLQS